jgi:hypothetical protein
LEQKTSSDVDKKPSHYKFGSFGREGLKKLYKKKTGMYSEPCEQKSGSFSTQAPKRNKHQTERAVPSQLFQLRHKSCEIFYFYKKKKKKKKQ